MKSAKYLLLKTTPTDFPTALAAWRNTARENKPSPNELMFCRKVRDGKPILQSHLTLCIDNNKNSQLRSNVSNSGKIQGPAQHDKTLRQQEEPETFQQGDSVSVQDPTSHRWNLNAVITGFSLTGRTLELLTERGEFIRRNRRFVRLKCAAQ